MQTILTKGMNMIRVHQENRRNFLRKFTLLGGAAAAGTLPASAAVNWLRTSAPFGNGEQLELEPDPSLGPIRPLDKVKITSGREGTVRVFDGRNRPYFKADLEGSLTLTAGGALGYQLVVLSDRKGKPVDYATLKVDCRTSVSDSSGKYRQLLEVLYFTMTNEWERESGVVRYNHKYYHHFVPWLRDHVHTLKGMKYFYHELKTGIELYAESQREDGMIWDNYNKRPPEGDYWEQRFDYGDFVRVVDDGKQEFRRIPVENDVEYLFIEGMYYTWKATGDDRWMEGMLDRALKALAYSTTDPYRWSEKYGLLKRGYTIDTWDFQNDEDAMISSGPDNLADPMVIRLPYTRFGIMFGDNTGMFASCNYLAEMLEHAGRMEEAHAIRETGEGIKKRLDELSWNGRFFTHHVPEDPDLIRDLGVDEKTQVSLSNAYSLNRFIRSDQSAAIIRTYQELREKMPASSPGEWYTIFPPFGKGYGGHNSMWSYMNGGVTTIVAGELAHGAFEHGFESYGVDILDRLLELSKRTGGFLHCVYRGAMEPPGERNFRPLPMEGIANTDTHGHTVEGVAGWTGEGENDLHEFPAGKQVFHEIPFQIPDPERNGRKVCLGLSGNAPYASEAELEVDSLAASFYFLHVANNSYYAGSIRLLYEDGSVLIDHIGPGKISNWWYPSAPQDQKQTPVMRVAWRGKNHMSRNVGVCLYGLNNPHPEKKVSSLLFKSAGTGTKWMVLGVTLSDQPVYFAPDFVSTGIPDNWGAAAVVYALVEGLCGVKDAGVAFNHTILSPRWPVAGENKAHVTIKYPASEGYVSYRYLQEGNTLEMEFTGSLEQSDLEIMLPGGRHAAAVSINGQMAEFQVKQTGSSTYLVVKGIPSVVNRAVITLA
jgi:hypothetical protein